MRFLAVFALMLAIFALPVFASANSLIPSQLVPQCGGVEDRFGPYCQACHLMQLVQNLINFAIFAASVVATLMFVYAGFLYVTAASAGQEQLKKAKSIFFKVFLGFVIVLVAWLIVDLIMKSFLNDQRAGVWNQIDCATFERVPVSLPGPGIDTPRQPATTTVGIRFSNSGVQRQYELGHASPELTALIGCMAQRVQFTITSISHNSIANGTHTWEECRQARVCEHSPSSWHFGGTTGNNLSYAMDVRTWEGENVAGIRNAARACGARRFNGGEHVYDEGSHFHIEVPPR